MKELCIIVVSWNRPHFLQQTLASIQLRREGLQTETYVVDNGSDQESQTVIRNTDWLTGYLLLDRNYGINAALERILPVDYVNRFSHILISDADMVYQRPFSLAINLLRHYSNFGAVSYQHSPEHIALGEFEDGPETWQRKQSERGCSLILETTRLEQMRPLPIDNLKDFDWWVCRDSPHSLQSRGEQIAVLPGGAHHLGWRNGDSTWQTCETPEFETYKR